MDWLDRMNRAMDYIEENLDAEISYDTIARIVNCSTFYFSRMFSFITGVPLSEYIRRRRLTLAAFELQTSDVKIIDVAFKYGYESAGAFGRAFKNLYGMLPSTLRAVGTVLTAYPKMTFTLSIKGGAGMDYRIVQKEAFEIFGVYKEVGMDMEQTFLDVSEFEKSGVTDGTWDRINAILGRPEGSWLLAAI